ncbi:MAG: hypothetical protein AAFS12_02780 [Cyanobacteria bacterium J06632_19]
MSHRFINIPDKTLYMGVSSDRTIPTVSIIRNISLRETLRERNIALP